jgi:hypothetical protein
MILTRHAGCEISKGSSHAGFARIAEMDQGLDSRFQVFPLQPIRLRSVALTASPLKPARLSWCPLKITPTEEGWRLSFFVKGDRPQTNSRAQKKDHENQHIKFRAHEPSRTVEHAAPGQD